MSRLLLALLNRFFRLGAAGDEGAPNATPVPSPEASPSESEEPSLDDILDSEEEAQPEVKEPEEDIVTLRARARILEDTLRQERELRNRVPTAAPAPAGRDPQEEAEERAYKEAEAKGADPGYLQTLRWQIDANRTLRRSERSSSQALAEAKDIADRSEFAALAQTQPKLYAKYKDQVEEMARNAKANGTPIPRKTLLALAVGNALVDGKAVKTVKKTAAAPAAERADRGRAPLAGARTDISGKEKKSDREARRARLENVRL